MRRSDRTCIWPPASVPVTLTRCPTRFVSRSLFAGSTSSIDPELRFRKPDFQLRDFGASAPCVSFSRNVSSPRSRHPASVTGAAFVTDGAIGGARGLCAGVTSAANVFARAGLVPDAVACGPTLCDCTSPAGSGDSRAANNIAAAMPHTATMTMAPAPILRVKPVDVFERTDFFELVDVFERVDFFNGMDVPLREIQ